MFLSYEKSIHQGVTTTNVKFRVWRVVRAFYRFAATGFAGAVEEFSKEELPGKTDPNDKK